MKYIAVIECTDAGGFEIGMAIVQMGYQPIFLLNPNSYRADLGLSLQSFEFRNVDTLSVDLICDELKKIEHQLIGVTTLVDSRLAIAAQVAKRLNILGPDQSCILLKDKAEVARLVHEYSLATASLSDCNEENYHLLDTIFKGKKLVAKHRSGCGAVGIQFLSSEEEKIEFIKNTQNLSEWILQEYFDGSLYSIEGWVENGDIYYLGWTSRRKIKNTETEFRFEGYQTIPIEINNFAQLAVRQLFNTTNFKRGWFHIEFLINADKTQAVMIDANVGRIGGAMLPHVLAMALNMMPVQIYQHAIEIQIFGKSKVIVSSKDNQEKIYKCICFGSPYETVLEQVYLPEYPLKKPGLRVVRILGAGDRVSKVGHDDWSWIGFVAGEETEVDHYASKIQIKSRDGYLHSAVF